MNNLEIAYLQTKYIVYTKEQVFSLCIGTDNSEFNSFCKNNYINKWSIITAYNPYSQLCSDKENQQANENLLRVIKDHGKTYLDALGMPLNNDWNAEKSFFIINIEDVKALQIARVFHQNAIVTGSEKGDVKLLWI